jgi:hypothetical protein
MLLHINQLLGRGSGTIKNKTSFARQRSANGEEEEGIFCRAGWLNYRKLMEALEGVFYRAGWLNYRKLMEALFSKRLLQRLYNEEERLCVDALWYLHLSPASRKRQRKGIPVSGSVTGERYSWGKQMQELGPPDCDSLKMGTVKCDEPSVP